METYVASLRSLEDMRREALQDPHVFSREKNRQLEAEALELQEQIEGPRIEGFVLRDNIQFLTSEALTRMLRRAGVIFESSLIFAELRWIAQYYLENLIRTSVTNADYRRSRVIMADDVLAARPLGFTLFGYGGPSAIRHVWSEAIYKVLKQVNPSSRMDPKALCVLNDIISYFLTNLVDKAKEQRMRARRYEQEWTAAEEDDDERAYFVKTYEMTSFITLSALGSTLVCGSTCLSTV